MLDDEDTEVAKHIEEKILSLGSAVIPFLEQEWEQNFNSDLQRRIEDLIHSLQFESLKNQLAKWKEEGTKDLLKGMQLVASYQYPELDLEKLNSEIEQMYYQVWVDFKKEMNPFDQIKLINDHLYNRLKFKANTRNFHSPNNSYINVVLESKKGNPISLCVIYMLIAQKLNLPVFGVNLPERFILTYKDEKQQFYINAFNRGVLLAKQDLDNYLANLGLHPKDEFYQPCDHRVLVMRVMRNLIHAYERLDEHEKADEVKTLLQAIMDPWELI